MLQTSTIDIINEINEGISRINSYASIALLQYHKNTGSNFEPPDTTIIDLCNKTCLRIDDMWTQAREDMFKGKHDNKIDEIGLIITKNFDRIIETINYCIQVGKILEKTNNIDNLELTKAATQIIKDKFHKEWPNPDWDTIKKSREDFKQGKYSFPDDLDRQEYVQ